MRLTLLTIALASLGLAGCQSVGSGAPPVGASLTDDDRAAAWNAQIAALNSGQRRSWRGDHGVFGLVEPGPAAGGGCRAYSQTIYIAGRPAHGRGVGCKQPDGSWKMIS
jgi:surface antigen